MTDKTLAERIEKLRDLHARAGDEGKAQSFFAWRLAYHDYGVALRYDAMKIIDEQAETIRRLREENEKLKTAGERLRKCIMFTLPTIKTGSRGEVLGALTQWYGVAGDGRGGQHVNKVNP